MKAILKSIDWSHENPYEYMPIERSDIYITFTCAIGLENEQGGDFFDITVCSPEYLISNDMFENKIIRHVLLVRDYDFEKILNIINKYIDKCDGNDWNDISFKLSRYFQWEYEDYIVSENNF
jgi:hypothetical protein